MSPGSPMPFFLSAANGLNCSKGPHRRSTGSASLQNARLLANPNAEIGYYPSIEEAARALAVKAIRIPYRDAVEIVQGIGAFAAEPNGGLIVMPPPPTITDRQLIVRLAAQHQLPAMDQDR